MLSAVRDNITVAVSCSAFDQTNCAQILQKSRPIIVVSIFTARRNACAVYAVVVCPSVCPPVRLTHAGIVPKRLNIGSRKRHKDSSFLTPKISAKFRPGHPQRKRQIEVR